MTLCNQLRESLGDVLKKHELNLTEVKDRLSTLEVQCQDINTRLCKLESKEPDQERRLAHAVDTASSLIRKVRELDDECGCL